MDDKEKQTPQGVTFPEPSGDWGKVTHVIAGPHVIKVDGGVSAGHDIRVDAIDAHDHDHQVAPAMLPAQYAVYDKDKKKVIQCHPHTDAGKRKVEWLCKALAEGTPFKLKPITLYMKAEDE